MTSKPSVMDAPTLIPDHLLLDACVLIDMFRGRAYAKTVTELVQQFLNAKVEVVVPRIVEVELLKGEKDFRSFDRLLTWLEKKKFSQWELNEVTIP